MDKLNLHIKEVKNGFIIVNNNDSHDTNVFKHKLAIAEWLCPEFAGFNSQNSVGSAPFKSTQPSVNAVLQGEIEFIRLVPEWANSEYARADGLRLKDYAIKSGLPERWINELTDAKHLLVLRKAMLYDELISAKNKAPAIPLPSGRPKAEAKPKAK